MNERIDAALSEEFAAFRQAVPTAFTAPEAARVFTTARTRTVRRRMSVAAGAVVVAAAAVVGTVIAGTTSAPAPAGREPTSTAQIPTTPAPTATPSASAASSASAGSASSGATTKPPSSATGPTSGGRPGQIRGTDWKNASITGLDFCGDSDDVVDFRNGSNGFDIPCRILPGGAKPAYAEFLVEEPANRPATEDALVLVELGNAGAARQQALIPVALGIDGRTLIAWPAIEGDPSSPAGDQVMTFTSYRVEGNAVVATVKRLDGTSETRRYRQAGMFGPWERF